MNTERLRGTCFSLSGERSSPLNFGHSWRPRQVSVRLATSPSTQRRDTAAKPENFAGCVEASKGELRSPDKLKHVPRKRPNSSGERRSPSPRDPVRIVEETGSKGMELSVEVPVRSPSREKRGALGSDCNPPRIAEEDGGKGTEPSVEERGALSQ